MNKAKIWLVAIRPKTLSASLAPVIMAASLANYHGYSNFFILAITLLCALIIQIISNLVNDYCDFINGADSSSRLGPKRVMQSGLASTKQMKISIGAFVVVAIFLGAILIAHGGITVLIIGLLSLVFAFLYTAGPYPLGYYGFGDILVLIFFGPIATVGTYYLISMNYNMTALLLGFAPGFIATSLLAVNNLRDAAEDVKVGKKTLAVIFGANFARLEYVLGIILSLFIMCAFAYYYSNILLAIFCLALFWQISPHLKKIYHKDMGSELNNVLVGTGKFLFLYAALFSLALLW